MVPSISISNFKSYRRATLRLSRVTFLIGANGAGKSNALDALRFLNWMGRGERLDDIDTRLGSGPGQIRGTPSDLFNTGQAEFDFDLTIDSGKTYSFHQAISRCCRGDVRSGEQFLAVRGESLKAPHEKVPLYCLKDRRVDEYVESVDVEYNNFAQGGNKPRIVCSNRQAVFYQLMSESRFETAKSRKLIPALARMLKAAFGQMLFLDADLSKMRGYARKVKGRMLEKDASNISSVIYNICQDPELKRRLLDMIRSLPELNIKDVSFVETEIGDVMLQLVEGNSEGKPTPITLLSDGTLRLLAIAAGLLSAPAGSLVVIEELDNGIHPSRVRHIVEQLYEIARAQDVQLLVTTHNPALMSAIPIPFVGDVLCCYRNPQDGGSEVLKLSQSPRFVELLNKGKLGDLATSDTLDAIIKDKLSGKQLIEEKLGQLDMFDEMFEKETHE